VAEPSQSKLISIPTGYGPTERKAIGQDIIRTIRRRTRSGLDVNGNLFAGYAKSYEKTGTVDLKLSGNMLGDLEVLSHGPGFIRIGFTDSESNDKASWIQRPTGQKAGKQSPRKFVGVSENELNNILGNYRL
jgi:hypothetical protein